MQIEPSDEDLEWPYPSCLLYGKEFFYSLSQSRDINGRSPNPFDVAKTFFLPGRKKRTRNLLVAYMGV